jgi:hypothetical protein
MIMSASREVSLSAWGIKSALFFQAALCIQAGIIASGWSVIGEYFDSLEAFLLWLGLAPLVGLLAAILWDSYARKLLAILGMLLFSLIGFAGGMALFEKELFQNAVQHGSHADDFAGYFALIAGANLVGLILGMIIHGLMGRSRQLREPATPTFTPPPGEGIDDSHQEWNSHRRNPYEK